VANNNFKEEKMSKPVNITLKDGLYERLQNMKVFNVSKVASIAIEKELIFHEWLQKEVSDNILDACFKDENIMNMFRDLHKEQTKE
jgi:hypothetical protein